MQGIVLHICCAPCALFPSQRLLQQGISLTGYFYNPNIHPRGEYVLRKEAVETFSRASGIEVEYPAYEPKEFFQQVNGKESLPQRCRSCWELRLRATARAAKARQAKGFTSSLLVSPYQDQEALRLIGEKVSQEESVPFLYEDYRPGFRAARDQARAQGLYCQKYCGCLYSEIERFSNTPRK